MCARLEALCACSVSPSHEIGTDPHVLFERSSEPCCALCESLVLRIASGRKLRVSVCAQKVAGTAGAENSGVLF